jgi:hypothetical protein
MPDEPPLEVVPPLLDVDPPLLDVDPPLDEVLPAPEPLPEVDPLPELDATPDEAPPLEVEAPPEVDPDVDPELLVDPPPDDDAHGVDFPLSEVEHAASTRAIPQALLRSDSRLFMEGTSGHRVYSSPFAGLPAAPLGRRHGSNGDGNIQRAGWETPQQART